MVCNVRKYLLLGKDLDDCPGEILEECARMMRLDLHPEVKGLQGKVAMEHIAESGDATKVQLLTKPIMALK